VARLAEVCENQEIRRQGRGAPHQSAKIAQRQQRQKWSNMANLGRSRRRRWRGAALGGPLQRACRFCLAGHDGQARTSQIAEWCRPEIVYIGGKPTAIQIAKHARALRSIGAVKVRREGRQWVWRLDNSSLSINGAIGRPLTPAFAISALLSKLRALFYNVANLRSR
jgi:hypothetical protein